MSQAEKLAQIIDQARSVALVRMSTAPLSFLASIAILVLIARSETKLTTTQNRLLVGLSISDIISSIATSFATIPMPKDTFYVWGALGNTSTCEAQAFLYVFGGLLTPFYNASMCIFFLLKIRYDMDDEKIRKRVEPFLHGVPIIYVLAFSIHCLVKKYFNASIGVCLVTDYPLQCSKNPNVPCQRGENYADDWVIILGTAIQFFVIPITIFGSMFITFITVLRQEHRMAMYGVGSLASSAAAPRTVLARFHENRYVRNTMYRGLAYSGAWFIIFIFPFIQVMQIIVSDTAPSYELRLLIAIFYPLQGVLNFAVYIYPKVIEVRRQDPDISIFQAFLHVLKTSSTIRQAQQGNRGTTRPTLGTRNGNRPQHHQHRDHDSMIVRSINEVPMEIVEMEKMVNGEGGMVSSLHESPPRGCGGPQVRFEGIDDKQKKSNLPAVPEKV